MIKRALSITALLIGLSLTLTSCNNHPSERSFNKAEVSQIKEITKDYIEKHPDLIVEAVKKYSTKKVFDVLINTIATKKPSTR